MWWINLVLVLVPAQVAVVAAVVVVLAVVAVIVVAAVVGVVVGVATLSCIVMDLEGDISYQPTL